MYSQALILQPHDALIYCNRSAAFLLAGLPFEAAADARRSIKVSVRKGQQQLAAMACSLTHTGTAPYGRKGHSGRKLMIVNFELIITQKYIA